MRLTATDIVSLYRPTPCSLRVYLREQSIPEAEPSAFDQILRTLGQRHELEHLASLGDYENLSVVPPDERIEQTAAAIRNRVPVIYQGEFSCETALTGIPVTIVGRPDFLILDGDGYVIRDSKLSRQVDEKHHEEITLQLQLYGWLFEQTVGVPAKRLEVHTGKGNIVDMPYDGGVAALAELVRILALKRLGAEPYEPVGWAKCAAGCGYYDHCWQQAEARQDVSLVMEVDQGLARKLHEDGIESAQQLVAGLDAQRLADLKRPWGDRQQKVGKKAEKILVYAGVLTSGKERMLGPVSIPAHDNYVMFDLEGMPPHLDDLEKIYLWGMRVYGKLPSAFMGVTAGFGTNGDQEGWAAFLDAAKKLFAVYGDIPFVHWHHYEKTHINQYIDRYGDPDGTAARVLRNLLDLLPIIKNAVALPLPSYSLKVVEEYIGFKRTQDEYGGSWAMAQFILATETDDEAQRSTRMSEILKYNKEDLAATWAVFEWLRGAGGTVHTTHGAGRGHQIPPEGIPQADYLVATSTQMAKILQLLENQQRQFELLLGTVSQRRVSRIPSDERGWQRVEPDETIEKNLFTSRPEIAAGIAATVQSFWPSFARLGQKTKNKWIFALHQAHFHAEADGLRAEMEETAVAWFAKAVELEVMSKIFLQFRDFVRRDSTLLHAAQEDGAYESTSAPLVKFISRNNPKLMLGDMAQAIKLSRNSSSCVFVELRKWIAAKCPAVDAAENFGEDLKQLATLAGPAKHGTVNASAVSKAQTLTRNILAVLAQ